MTHLANFVDGFASVFSGCAPMRYPVTSGGFERDQNHLRNDVLAVGKDITKTTNRTLKEYRDARPHSTSTSEK